jgi:phage N-6-adenine-methyltransferase
MNLQLPEKYKNIRNELATYTKIDEVKNIRDKALAMEIYAYQTRDAELVGWAMEIKAHATRRIGELMDGKRAAGELAVGTRGSFRGKKAETGKGKPKGKGKAITTSGGVSNTPPEEKAQINLAQLGIDKNLAKAARKAASTPLDRYTKQTAKQCNRAKKAVVDSQQTKRRQASSGKKDWYTPRQYLDAAIEVMGNIDLDPASSRLAQKHVKATQFFTEEDNGLTQKWSGHVFLNPPYAAKLVRDFTLKIIDSYQANDIRAGILLTNNATDTEWWNKALEAASAVCFTTGRIHFLERDGDEVTEKNSNTCGQTFFYFGRAPVRFSETFSRFGRVIYGFTVKFKSETVFATSPANGAKLGNDK